MTLLFVHAAILVQPKYISLIFYNMHVNLVNSKRLENYAIFVCFFHRRKELITRIKFKVQLCHYVAIWWRKDMLFQTRGNKSYNVKESTYHAHQFAKIKVLENSSLKGVRVIIKSGFRNKQNLSRVI